MNITNTPDCGVDCMSNLKRGKPNTFTFFIDDTEITEEMGKAIERIAELWRKEVDEQILKLAKENKNERPI